jgi:hypothetical protein
MFDEDLKESFSETNEAIISGDSLDEAKEIMKNRCVKQYGAEQKNITITDVKLYGYLTSDDAML